MFYLCTMTLFILSLLLDYILGDQASHYISCILNIVKNRFKDAGLEWYT